LKELFSAGDAHAAQGHGEADLTAIRNRAARKIPVHPAQGHEAHLAARRDAHPLDSDGLHPDLDEGMKITAMADLKTSPAVMTLRGLRPTRENASAHQTF
jgi:hypothetical protein